MLLCAALQLEDLVKVEGMTEKRFSSFIKVSRSFCSLFILSELPFYKYIIAAIDEINSHNRSSVDITPQCCLFSFSGKHPECLGKVTIHFLLWMSTSHVYNRGRIYRVGKCHPKRQACHPSWQQQFKRKVASNFNFTRVNLQCSTSVNAARDHVRVAVAVQSVQEEPGKN